MRRGESNDKAEQTTSVKELDEVGPPLARRRKDDKESEYDEKLEDCEYENDKDIIKKEAEIIDSEKSHGFYLQKKKKLDKPKLSFCNYWKDSKPYYSSLDNILLIPVLIIANCYKLKVPPPPFPKK